MGDVFMQEAPKRLDSTASPGVREVPGFGPTDHPRFMIIGEAPGKDEEVAGRPFIGRSGQLLNEALRAAGIERDECYITNVVKVRPQTPTGANKKPTKAMLKEWLPILKEEIRQISPSKIILLGSVPTSALLRLTLQIARGSTDTLLFEGVPVTSCYHPAASLHDPSKRVAFFGDIARAVGGSTPPPSPIKGRVFFTAQLDDGPIAVDIETTEDGSLIGIGLADSSHEMWLDREDTQWLQALDNHPWIFHNAKFDVPVLQSIGVVIPEYDDTMLMAYVLRRKRLGLKDLAEGELGVRVTRLDDLTGGDLTQIEFVDRQKLAEYCMQDARLTYELFQKFQIELIDGGLWNVYHDLDLPLVPVVSDMEQAGITIDIGHLQALEERVDRELNLIQISLEALTWTHFNAGSGPQKAKLLYETLGLPILERTEGGQPATDTKTIERLIKRGHDEAGQGGGILGLLKLDSEYRKLKSTYLRTLIERAAADPESRVHTRYNITVAETGRLSSSGPNLQNIPIRTELGREVRRAFIASPGHVLIKADFEQQELRLAACFGPDEGMLDAFRKGIDIHEDTAQRMSTVTGRTISRRDAKTLNFGILYGMGDEALGEALGVGRKVGGDLIEAWFQARPGIKRYVDRVRQFAIEHGYVETISGRRLYTPGVYGKGAGSREAAFREAVNMPIQGSAADLMRALMRYVWEELGRDGRVVEARLLLQVHDELVIECVNEVSEIRTVYSVLGQGCSVIVQPYGVLREVEFPMEVKVLSRWGE